MTKARILTLIGGEIEDVTNMKGSWHPDEMDEARARSVALGRLIKTLVIRVPAAELSVLARDCGVDKMEAALAEVDQRLHDSEDE